MANKSTEKKTRQVDIEQVSSVEEATSIEGQATKKPEKVRLVPKEIDPNQYVTVRNGFQGRLVYRSKKTGELFVWDEFGDEQEMELAELKNAKNSAKKFFINNWFMFDEPWIAEYLGMSNFYRYAVPIDDFDSIFEKPLGEAEAIISKMSDGQKRSLSYRAHQLIADNRIDSNRMIDMLEKCLGTNLIER